jgi:hypothetical protein
MKFAFHFTRSLDNKKEYPVDESSKKRIIENALGKMSGSPAQGMEEVLERDSRVRKAVADLYMVLESLGRPDVAVNMLAEHVAIMVDMINDFKNRR